MTLVVPSSSSSSCKHIAKLLEMLRLQSIVEQTLGAQGFSHHALGLHYDQLQRQKFHWSCQQQALTLEYTLPQQPLHADLSLAPLLAVMDDVTSWSALLGDLKRRRFGVSVHLRAERPTTTSTTSTPVLEPGTELLIQTKNAKIGRNLAFIDVSVQDAHSKQLVAFGSHIKYLDMGPLLNWGLSSRGWPLLNWAVHKMDQSPLVAKTMERLLPYRATEFQPNTPLFESLQLANDGDKNTTTATFCPQSRHASLGGPLHGGCQACLLELIGNHQAQKSRNAAANPVAQLEALQVDYLSTPKRGPVELQAEALVSEEEDPPQQSVSVQAQIMSKGGRVASQANLRFVSAEP